MGTQLTINDLCQLEGAITVIERYAKHLQRHARNAILNYESSDFEEEVFLVDVAYAANNIEVIKLTVETVEEILLIMKKEIGGEENG